MRTLIVEDEAMARKNLSRILEENFPDIEIVGYCASVMETVTWLSQNKCDLIFMDVELSDGNCFEIFRLADVKAKVVMTTAYDSYALKAFEVNSIDYILKPVELPALQRAVERARNANQPSDIAKVLAALAPTSPTKQYKERFLVRLNDRIVPVNTVDVAYFFSENKASYLCTYDKIRYILNPSLDDIEADLDPDSFFRISRSFIVSKLCVKSVTKIIGGRLRLSCEPATDQEIEVSRSRVDDFLVWLEK